jgi:cytochrome P450
MFVSNEASTSPDPYSLFTPEALVDPYPVYERLRAEDPVHWDDQFHAWLLTRYADVKTFLYDPRASSKLGHKDEFAGLPDDLQEMVTDIYQFLSLWLSAIDPPEHRRLRHLLSAGFKPRLIENLRPRIQDIADELLDAIGDANQIEFMNDFAYPLPAMVIADMLGMPASDRVLMRDWSRHIMAILQFGQRSERTVIEGMHRTIQELYAYLRGFIADRRRAPQDDLLSNLLAAEEQGTVLTEDELVSTCALLLFAGHETTMNLLGNGLLALFEYPDQYELLKADPSLAPAAVEEMLRYRSPVHLKVRTVREDLEIGGKCIRAGEGIRPCLGAANHDPAQFPNPHKFDIRRPNADTQIVFGHGIHYCLGAPLARLEGQIAFPTLLRRLPGLQGVMKEATWRGAVGLRGLSKLPVTFDHVRPRCDG